MENITELFVNERKKMAIGFLAGYGIWQGTRILHGLFGRNVIPHVLDITLIVIQIIAWILWFYFLIRMITLGRKIRKDPKLKVALNDELTRHIRLKSLAAGFWSLVILQMLLSVSAAFLKIDVRTVLDINLYVAVLAFIISFLFYERETA